LFTFVSQYGMRRLIHENMRRCMWQRRLDTVLSLVSMGVIILLICHIYSRRIGILIPFVLATGVVHAAVLFYCRRLWTIRIRKWQALDRGWVLTLGVQEIVKAPGELQLSLPGSEDTAGESLLSPPILS
jgi:hypothetical protein